MFCQAYCTKTEWRKLTINFHKGNLEQSILWTPKAVPVSLWKARFSTIFTRRDGRIAVPYRRFRTRLRRRPPHLFSESSTASNSCCEKVLGRKLRLRRKEEGTGGAGDGGGSNVRLETRFFIGEFIFLSHLSFKRVTYRWSRRRLNWSDRHEQ